MTTVTGTGLGLRRPHLAALRASIPPSVKFFEVAPENWMGVGGRLGEAFTDVASQRPLACHGLLLNIGGADPLDRQHLALLKTFLDTHRSVIFSDHLSFCADRGLLYELLPIPFTEEAVLHAAARIREVQDFLGQRIAIENPSYYLTLSNELGEIDFLCGVLEEADCNLLLDVNNVYVNSVNHSYDARAFIRGLPRDRIVYGHIAGHSDDAPDLKIDTHGQAVSDPVWDLLEFAYRTLGVFPTMLERDLDIPPLEAVISEVEKIARLQQAIERTAAA